MNRSTRILVVDDKQSFRFMIKGYLDDAGYQAVCAACGAEALEQLEQEPFDLVLSDMIMPEMDGAVLLREVRSRHPHIPFVLITAHGTVESAVTAMKEGANDYLLKPLNRTELLMVVERLLENDRLRVNYGRMLDSERKKGEVAFIFFFRSKQILDKRGVNLEILKIGPFQLRLILYERINRRGKKAVDRLEHLLPSAGS